MIEKKQLNIELTMAIVEFNLKQFTKTKYDVIKKGESFSLFNYTF